MAKREKKPVHHIQMTAGKRQLIRELLQEYEIKSAQDIQEALKDLLGCTIKEMMEAEMEDHLGYGKSERIERTEINDYRNGTKPKTVNSNYGSFTIEVPQDRDASYEPHVVKKHQKDITDIDSKIISMYAKGMTTRQISDIIKEIYGFEASEGFISDVTDKVLPKIEEWQNRPLSAVYPIVFIDAIHFSVREDSIIRKLAGYIVLGINEEGMKEVLTIEVGENESSKYWLGVFNGLSFAVLQAFHAPGLAVQIDVDLRFDPFLNCGIGLFNPALRGSVFRENCLLRLFRRVGVQHINGSCTISVCLASVVGRIHKGGNQCIGPLSLLCCVGNILLPGQVHPLIAQVEISFRPFRQHALPSFGVKPL